MFALVSGIILGMVLAVLIGFLVSVIHDICYTKKSETIVLLVGAIACIAVLIFIPGALVNYDMHCYKSWTNEYKIQKDTIESSLRSEKIGGLERVELVKMAQDLNEELVENQYRCQQWYGFTGDKEVLNLEPIKFE